MNRLLSFPFRLLYRLKLRNDRAWIRNCIAEREAQHRDHARTIKQWKAEIVEIDHKLNGSKPSRLRTLWPRDPRRV